MLQGTGAKASGTGVKVVGPADGKSGSLGMIGVRFMVDGDETEGRFSLVEHPMPPRALAAPLHRHLREDEYSFVLEGQVGALLGDEVVIASSGDLVFKPRNQWHTFWNAGDEPARILEIIAPSGFERFFDELVDLGGAVNADPRALAELCQRYGLEMQPDSIPGLIERFGLRAPGDTRVARAVTWASPICRALLTTVVAGLCPPAGAAARVPRDSFDYSGLRTLRPDGSVVDKPAARGFRAVVRRYR